jgi:hypothetical protein
MSRLDIFLAKKIINNELCYEITKDNFFSIILPEKNVKFNSNCIYYENTCFHINNRLPNSLYTIYNAYSTDINNNDPHKRIAHICASSRLARLYEPLGEDDDNTLSIKQLILLLNNINIKDPRIINTSNFIVNIK